MIKNYNDMIYGSRPVKYTEFITNKYNDVHAQLYNDALNRFLKDLKNDENFSDWSDYEIKNNLKIIEVKNKEYWMPSSVIVIKKVYPFSKHKFSLEKYWNYYQRKSLNDITNIKMLDETILNPEILSLNYVNGKAKIECRQQDIELEVDFDYISENTRISDDYSLNNTFVHKYNNL